MLSNMFQKLYCWSCNMHVCQQIKIRPVWLAASCMFLIVYIYKHSQQETCYWGLDSVKLPWGCVDDEYLQGMKCCCQRGPDASGLCCCSDFQSAIIEAIIYLNIFTYLLTAKWYEHVQEIIVETQNKTVYTSELFATCY